MTNLPQKKHHDSGLVSHDNKFAQFWGFNDASINGINKVEILYYTYFIRNKKLNCIYVSIFIFH